MTQATLDTWTAAFGAAYIAQLLPQCNANYHTTSVASTFFVDGTNTNVMSSQQTATGTGGSGASGESELSIVISWLTTAYWRGGKPRTYLPAAHVNVDGAVTSRWTTGFVAGTLTKAIAFRNAINALTGGAIITQTRLGVVSFQTGNIPRVPPLFLEFVDVKVHPRIGTQRRRKGKWLA